MNVSLDRDTWRIINDALITARETHERAAQDQSLGDEGREEQIQLALGVEVALAKLRDALPPDTLRPEFIVPR